MRITPSMSAPETPDAQGPPARVYDLAAARERRERRVAGEIPAEVWAEVEAANRLFEELEAEGRRIVFDDTRLDGPLIVSLCDLEGRILRLVGADEVVGATTVDDALHDGGAA